MLYHLPDDILCSVFQLLHPTDLITVSIVCKSWNHLSSLEEIWERALAAQFSPKFFGSISASLVPGEPYRDSRSLYKSCCAGAFLCDGKQRIKISKENGLVTFSLSISLGMNVMWFRDDQYSATKIADVKLSHFRTVSLMLDVCWFHVKGKGWFQFTSGKFEICWRLSRCPSRSSIIYFDNYSNVFFSWPFNEAHSKISIPALGIINLETIIQITEDSVAQFPEMVEICVGTIELSAKESYGPMEIIAELYETESGEWKSGVYFDCLVIRQISK